MEYQVLIDDNFHYAEPEHRSTGPQFATLEEAVTYCKRVVEDSLLHHYRLGMPAHELLTQYLLFGDDPFVYTGEGGVPFSARAYAATWIREVYGDWQWRTSSPDHPWLSWLTALLLAPVVEWRIRRRMRRPVG